MSTRRPYVNWEARPDFWELVHIAESATCEDDLKVTRKGRVRGYKCERKNKVAKQTLTDISDDMSVLDELLAEGDIESPEAQEIICAWAVELNDARDKKVDNICAFIANTEARAAVRAEESKRLKAKADRDEKNVEWLKSYLKKYFESNQFTKLETNRYTVSIVGNGGHLPIEYSVPAEKLPEKYRRVVTDYKPLTDEIRAALMAKEVIPGVTLGKRGTRLSIR